MDHEKRILNKIMKVQELRPEAQQVARQITRDTYNFSYIIWALVLIACVGSFMYVIGKNTESNRATTEAIKQLIEQQKMNQVYLHSLENEIVKLKEQNK